MQKYLVQLLLTSCLSTQQTIKTASEIVFSTQQTIKTASEIVFKLINYYFIDVNFYSKINLKDIQKSNKI